MKGLILYLIIALLNQQNFTGTQGGKAHTNSCQPQGHRVWGAQDGGMAGLEGPQPPSVPVQQEVHKRPGGDVDPLSRRVHGSALSTWKSEVSCYHGGMFSYYGSLWVLTRILSLTKSQPGSPESSCGVHLNLGR